MGSLQKEAPENQMKYVKKIVSFLAVICFLAGSPAENAVPAYAASRGLADGGPVPVPTQPAELPSSQVIFENEEKQSPDLYISKRVEHADESYPAPKDDEFRFILKIDGKLADQVSYQVYDAENEEVDGDFQTGKYGTFSLKAGQTARFEYLGTGVRYEVSEESKDNYQQIIPEGGAPASGIVTANGAEAEFTNLYSPKGEGGKTRLEIRKTISFPSGYEPPETPDFPFVLELDGKAYGGGSYTVVDIKTGETTGSGVTGQDGSFTLKGGSAAVFEEIPAGVDYKVREDEEQLAEKAGGWWTTGNIVREGATQPPVTVEVFNNANASFMVTKRMEDYSRPDKEFTFLLTDADRVVWPEAQYCLYSTTGERVDDQIHQTDKDGRFQLKPGQAAVFMGIKPGTVYNVSEIGNAAYVQVIPSSPEGYPSRLVGDGVEELPFVNKPADAGQVLTVTKHIENTDGEAPFAPGKFQFILSRKGPGGEYMPVENAVYAVQEGGSVRTYKTGAGKENGGKFTIQANETARFYSLDTGDYKVEEDQDFLTSEYQLKETAPQEGTLKGGSSLDFAFTNQYTPKKVDLVLVKKNDKGDFLEGAEFMLYRDEALTDAAGKEPPDSGQTGESLGQGADSRESIYVTGRDGKVSISGLKTGTYWLKETKSPSGYVCLEKPIKIQLERDGSHVKVTVDDGEYKKEDLKIELSDKNNDQVEITVYNNKLYQLPSSGGPGIYRYLISGILLMMAAALILYRNKRGGEVRGKV